MPMAHISNSEIREQQCRRQHSTNVGASLYFYKGTHISTFTKERTSLLLQRNAHLYFYKGTHINYVHSCVIVDAGSSNHSQHEREATKACTVLERQLYLLLSWIPSSTSTVHTN